MFKSKDKPERLASTAFSDFIRNASAREKKRVYTEVMKKASERQNRLLQDEKPDVIQTAG